MPKLNYFDSLERLAIFCSRAVFIACSSQKVALSSELSHIRISADKCVCELEKALFSDFMPPLERRSTAECAHALARVIEKCNEISNHRVCKTFLAEKKNFRDSVMRCEIIWKIPCSLSWSRKKGCRKERSGWRRSIHRQNL